LPVLGGNDTSAGGQGRGLWDSWSPLGPELKIMNTTQWRHGHHAVQSGTAGAPPPRWVRRRARYVGAAGAPPPRWVRCRAPYVGSAGSAGQAPLTS
jgi:hypothetical protein